MQRILKAGVGLAAAGVLGSCTFSANSAHVPAADVAEQVEDQVEQQFGMRPEVTCPTDLPAEVDAEIECELHDGDEVHPVEITVTEVDGSDASFNIHIPGPAENE
ncbi:MAG TPA: DUF4333 domain-containing protein [Beutenbergiaceae bacterium]|nr:DUF4333 domain-containing protein [Beutenbergiaceae bacterium]